MERTASTELVAYDIVTGKKSTILSSGKESELFISDLFKDYGCCVSFISPSSHWWISNKIYTVSREARNGIVSWLIEYDYASELGPNHPAFLNIFSMFIQYKNRFYPTQYYFWFFPKKIKEEMSEVCWFISRSIEEVYFWLPKSGYPSIIDFQEAFSFLSRYRDYVRKRKEGGASVGDDVYIKSMGIYGVVSSSLPSGEVIVDADLFGRRTAIRVKLSDISPI